MKAILLAVSHSYLFFGTTLYCGVLWGMHFFWFPTWKNLRVQNYYEHMIPQTAAATKFFFVVVPLMVASIIVMIISEWGLPLWWVPWVALICLSLATVWGTMRIIPINRKLKAGVTDPVEFAGMLKKWLALNNMRWVVLTIMWIDLMIYFICRGDLLLKLGGGR